MIFVDSVSGNGRDGRFRMNTIQSVAAAADAVIYEEAIMEIVGTAHG